MTENFNEMTVLTQNMRFYPFNDQLGGVAYIAADSEKQVKEFEKHFETSLPQKRKLTIISKFNKNKYLSLFKAEYDMSVSSIMYELQSPYWSEFIRNGFEERRALILGRDNVEVLKERLSLVSKIVEFNYKKYKPFKYANLESIKQTFTANQLKLLSLAYENGFFEWPRKTNLNVLAEELGKSKVAISKELRSIDKKTFSQLLNTS
ncbi:MAG: helix-turn-helix domain-containing protein [Nitrososphaerota archaeon]|nr:helix-turn-helix domain-containing protein [Nitrososphaerota archaeon]MDG6930591.1 helix-turn-helix domain-containing protein [Nitrososphaerota archaeon]